MKLRWNVTFMAVLVNGAMGLAQTPRASISGVVTDPSGQVVPNVNITVTDLERGTAYQTHTNQTGVYLVPELIPATYRVTAELSGFRTFQVDNFTLSAQQRAVLNIALEVGNLSQKVEVKSQIEMVEASTATLGGVVENRMVDDLPLNNRNVFNLMVLVPGVAPSTPNNYSDEFFTNAVRYSVNGGLESTSDIQLDGISANASSDIPGIYGLGALPSVDSIQEFRVQTNDFSAEYGRSGGGIVTMVTKSGTNSLHGDLFEYLRNNDMDANTFFSNRSGGTVPQLQRNQFGGSAGGPIVKNRTFFFVTYEQKVQHAGGFELFTVPSVAERRGDFSQTFDSSGNLRVLYNPFSTHVDPATNQPVRDPFAGNIIPASRMDPVALKAMAYYPAANLPGDKYTETNNLGLTGVALSPNYRVDFKADHNFSDTKRFFLRYNYFKDQAGDINYFNNPAINTWGTMQWTSHNAVLDYTQTFSSTTIMDIRAGVNRFVAFRPSFADNFDIASLGLPASLKSYAGGGSEPMFPMFSIEDYTSLGPPYQNGAYYSSHNTNYTFLGSLVRVVGRHTIKTGIDVRSYQLNFLQIDGDFGAQFGRAMTQGPNALSAGEGDGFASFLLGTADTGYAPYQPQLANANKYFAQYVQDDFKWTPRLTLNVGFRLEEETSATERYNRLTAMDLTVRNPISDQVGFNAYGGYLFAGGSLGRRAIRPIEYKMNPRFGVAWQVNDRTTIRTGYGIFYGVSPSGATRRFAGAPFSTASPFLATLDGVTPFKLLSNPYPAPQDYVYPQGASAGLLAAVGTDLETGLPSELNTGYNQQWNFTIQRSVGPDMLLQVAYAGNKGTHLSAFEWSGVVNADQLQPQQLQLGSNLLKLVNNPFYGIIQSGTLAQPLVQQGQLLRPYPEWTSVFPAAIGVGNSEYNALQALFQKRYSNGISFIASYTWSKLMSDVADGEWANGSFSVRDWYCWKCEHSVSVYDVPHRFTFSFTYELPFGKGRPIGSSWPAIVDYVLGGWQVNTITTLASGHPLSFSVGTNTSYSFGGNQHPDATGINASMGNAQSIYEWFNTAAFSHPAAFTFGNLDRTFTGVRSDSTKNVDFSIFKSFKITERFQTELRAEAYNLTNTPVFSAPNTTVDSGSFGVVTSQSNIPRQIQLGLKLSF